MCHNKKLFPKWLSMTFLVAIGIWNADFSLAREETTSLISPEENTVSNVRIIDNTRRWAYARNVSQMQGSCPAREIAYRYLTKQTFPLPPLPPVKIIQKSDGRTAWLPASAQPEDNLVSPVAWSLKVVNLDDSFLPQLREEVIVLIKYGKRETEGKKEFDSGTWVLVCCRKASRGCNWKVSFSPELIGIDLPKESSPLHYRPNLKQFKVRPKPEQIMDFVQSTDFGNNDIYNYTSEVDQIKVKVLLVAVYSDYSEHLKVFSSGPSPEIISQRKDAYAESFRRSGLIPFKEQEN